MHAAERLRELRESKHLNQQAFAALVGVSKTTQNNYETGKRKPTYDYLESLAAAGVDVYYLLTGHRDPKLLTDQEKELLLLFKALSAEGKRQLLRGLEAERAPRLADPAKPRDKD